MKHGLPPQTIAVAARGVFITNLSMLTNQSQVNQLHDGSIESQTSGSNHFNIVVNDGTNLGVTRTKKMKSNYSSNQENERALVRQDTDVMANSPMDGGATFLGVGASSSDAAVQAKLQSDTNVKLTSVPSVSEPARQTSSSITSSNSNSGSVTFALPATIATSTNRQPSTRSYNSEASSGSISSSGGENTQPNRPALKVHTNLSTANVAAANRISGSSNASSNHGSNTSGSGSDGGGNNTSSTSNNNPVVTAGNATTTTANSNNSSGSGSDGGGSGNRRSGGEASNEYYYAGYGSGSLATNGSLQARHYHHRQETEAGASARAIIGMPSFASFHGASIAAVSAELNMERNHGHDLPPPPPLPGALLGPEGMLSRHVVAAADESSNPPNIAYATSHLRHHSRHAHHRRAPLVPAAAAAQAGHALSGIPSSIGPPNHYNVRLPPAEENAMQRVPQAQEHEQHVTVVANDVIPPPQTSSDAWSSASSSRSAARGEARKRPAVAAANAAAAAAATMAPATRAGGGSVNTHSSMDSATMAKSTAVHVSTDDPILKPSIFSQGPQKKVAIKSNAPQVPSLESPVKSLETAKLATPADGMVKSGSASHKRKASMLLRGGTSDDSSDGGARSDTEAVGSGSEEGYEASSSSNADRQSGSSGSDSVSSDDVNKNKMAKTRNSTSLSNPGKKATRMESQSGKRTETSSMSSSVLADFSSGVNEEVNSFSSSPNSSCMSLNDFEDVNKAKSKAEGNATANTDSQPMATTLADTSGRKRGISHLGYAPPNHRKRSHHDTELKDTDVDRSAPGNTMKSGLALMEKSLQQKVRSAHHHYYHSRSTGRKMLEESFLSAKRNLSSGSSPEDAKVVTASALESSTSTVSVSAPAASSKQQVVVNLTNSAYRPMNEVSFQDTLIYSLGADVMALVVSFLEVPESHTLLTSPLSKTWLETYTAPQELWKIMCTSGPFYAKLEESPDGRSDVSTCSFPLCNDLEMRHLFGRYRLLYSSFVRCMKYLDRLRDDALNGRTPTVYNNASQRDLYPYNRNGSLKAYFARARRLVRRNRRNGGVSSSGSDSVSESLTTDSGEGKKLKEKLPTGASSGSEHGSRDQQNPSGPRTARSMLTDRLLRPTRAGDVDNVNLPWSCAIYSVVNWMVAFVDVEGIQIMCLKVLPYLLEDETQRTTAQRAGLTDSVLRAMVIFPDSIELHTAAFHTLVLLARPLGGNEGMLFHTAMVNTRGIFNSGGSTSGSKNGIVIMLDSMRRFAQDEMLQAMSCWSLVNVALTPLQKSMLVKLGGLTVTANAMLQHPYNAEVQFRALFALINLVIPSEIQTDETEEQREFEREIFQQLGEVGETSEREMLDASVGQISNLVVVAMKNFCSSEAILNRACLVLHNLSLNEEYHSILLWTPNCYQMLEWCIGNYPHDHVLQQSAGGTITRLNATLSADDELRARFTHSIRAQQQHSLELARREAVYLQEQQQEQSQRQNDS